MDNTQKMLTFQLMTILRDMPHLLTIFLFKYQ